MSFVFLVALSPALQPRVSPALIYRFGGGGGQILEDLFQYCLGLYSVEKGCVRCMQVGQIKGSIHKGP